MGLCEVLFVIFLIMKLMNSIDWSWFAVFSPLLITAVLYLTLFFISAMK